jgi:HAD superfamily hydrolase (TIGR01549 family)
MPNISSFDVFDTCLTRKVACPIDVFRLMAPDVARLAGMEYSERWGEEFVRVRVNAEHDTRKGNSSGETNLQAIWREIRRVMGFQDHDFDQIELEWEESLIHPIAETQEKVLRARNKDDKIIFLSDMYLPSDFIKKLLGRYDFFRQGDKIYVSCEIGATKSSGEMYRHIQEDLGVPSCQITHYGDNVFSDIKPALTAGCRAVQINDAKLNLHEEGLRKCADIPPHFSTRLVGAIKASRLAKKLNVGDLASQFATPFLYVFVNWVLEQAEADGVERLYFLGRDCQLAHKFACHPVLLRSNLECRYLHASRRAYMLASVREVSPAGIPWLDRRYDEKEIDLILDKLELVPDEFEKEWRSVTGRSQIPKRIDGPDDWNSLWDTLRSEKISSAILKNANLKKSKLQLYLIQEGVMEKKIVAFVDLGWKFSIQRSAQIVLQELNPDFHLLGYYLGASVEHSLEVTAKKLFMPVHREDFGSNYSCSFFPDKSIFLEHVLGRATHSTLVDFENRNEKINPVTSPLASKSLISDVETFHKDALNALDYYQNLGSHISNEQHGRALIKSLITLVYNKPSREMAQSVAGLAGGFDAYGKCEKIFVSPYSWFEFFKALFFRNPCHSKREWKEGSFAVTPRFIRGMSRRLNMVDRLLTY